MKNLFFLILICFLSHSLMSQLNGFIGSTDVALYIGYENEIGAIAESNDCVAEVKATNASVKYLGNAKYTVIPDGNSRVCEITLSCLDKGIVKVQRFAVKKIPSPVLRTSSISGSRGGYLDAGLEDFWNLKGIKFQIISGLIDGKSFVGDLIPKDLTNHLAIGKEVTIDLKVKNLIDGRIIDIQGKVLIK